jgi:hypothetical protein
MPYCWPVHAGVAIIAAVIAAAAGQKLPMGLFWRANYQKKFG